MPSKSELAKSSSTDDAEKSTPKPRPSRQSGKSKKAEKTQQLDSIQEGNTPHKEPEDGCVAKCMYY